MLRDEGYLVQSRPIDEVIEDVCDETYWKATQVKGAKKG